MYGACIFYNKYIKGNQYNDFNYILFLKERKTKSKQSKHFKWGTFKFYGMQCNSTQKMPLWIHNFENL
jgi:hypothetical protein